MKMPRLQKLEHYEGIEGLDYIIEFDEHEQVWEVRVYSFFDKEWWVLGHYDELDMAFWGALDCCEKEHKTAANLGGCKRDDCLWCKENVPIVTKNNNAIKRSKEKKYKLKLKESKESPGT
jgi:hypothetical protein